MHWSLAKVIFQKGGCKIQLVPPAQIVSQLSDARCKTNTFCFTCMQPPVRVAASTQKLVVSLGVFVQSH
jgi:hypothetical protein